MESQLRIPWCPDRIFTAEFKHVHDIRITRRRRKSLELFLVGCTSCRNGHPAYRGNVLRRDMDQIRQTHPVYTRRCIDFDYSTYAHAELPDSPCIGPSRDGSIHPPFHGPFNVTMQPFRALVADMLDDSQKTEGYVVQTFLINIGAVIGAVLPLIMTWAGVSDEAVPGQVSSHIAWSYYIGGAVLLATVLVTAFRTKEYPPKEFAEYNGIAEVNASEPAEKPSFMTLIKNTPSAMIRIGVTQFFSWAALFIMWTYLKPAITGSVTAGGVLLTEGETQTWVGVLNGVYPIPACIAALFMTKLAARFGNKRVYATCLLFGVLGFAGLCLLKDKYALMIPMLGIGIAWAGILAMPYAILSRAVDPKRMGVYMGIFNFTITIPQIVIGLTGGVIVKYCFGSNAVMMLALACVFMLLAAVSVAFIREN